MTEAERRAALEAIADEVRSCTNCRLHESRTHAVPGEGHPSTEVAFVGEGPGRDEDAAGRPFVGQSGQFLTRLIESIGWRREDVFITNVVKCRPPGNRDPQADEIAACAPFLRRQLEVLDPALVVTLGRFSLGSFRPGERIGQAHGTARPAAGAGPDGASVFAMYHPAYAVRDVRNEGVLLEDMRAIPSALVAARRRREVAPGASERSGPAGADAETSSAAGPAAGGPGTPETTAAPATAGAPATAATPVTTATPTAAAPSATAVAVAEPDDDQLRIF